MSDHERIEELVAVHALGGLDGPASRELVALQMEHGEHCEECRRLEREYGEVAGRLAFAVSPEEIPEGMEDALVQRVTGAARHQRQSWPRRWLAGVAAAVLLVGGALGGYLVAPRHGTTNPLAGAQITTMHGSGPGTVTIAYRPGSGRTYLIATELPDAPAGHLYELWFFHGTTPVRAATFVPNGGAAVVQVPANATGMSQAAITVERVPGVSKPTTTPIFAAPIQGPIRSA